MKTELANTWTTTPRKDTGLGLWKPLVTRFLSADKHIALFYILVFLIKDTLFHIDCFITLASAYVCVCVCVCAPLLSHVWLFAAMDCSLPGSSAGGISQARILEWVAISSSRGSSQPRDQTHAPCVSCIGRQITSHYHHLGSSSYFSP